MNNGTRIVRPLCSAIVRCLRLRNLERERFIWFTVLKGQEFAPNDVLLDGRGTTREETRSAHVSPSWKVTRIQPLGNPDDVF